MTHLEKTHYDLTLLADGLKGLGLSMSVHNMPGNKISANHALCLAHLVESCGHLAQRLATDLEGMEGEQ